MRYLSLVVLLVLVCSCGGNQTQLAGTYNLIDQSSQPVVIDGTTYRFTYEMPAQWVRDSTINETSSHAFFASYQHVDSGVLTLGVAAMGRSSAELSFHFIEEMMQYSDAFEFTILGSSPSLLGPENVVYYVNRDWQVAGAIVYRNVPGLDGITLRIGLSHHYSNDGHQLEDIALVLAVADSFTVRVVK